MILFHIILFFLMKSSLSIQFICYCKLLFFCFVFFRKCIAEPLHLHSASKLKVLIDVQLFIYPPRSFFYSPKPCSRSIKTRPTSHLTRSLALPPSLSFFHTFALLLARSLNSSLSCFCAATTPRPRRGWTRDSPRRPSRPRSARRTVSSNYSSLN